MTLIKSKTSNPSITNATTTTQSKPTAKANAGRIPDATSPDALERSPAWRLPLEALTPPSLAAQPELGAFKLNDLLNGLVPSMGKDLAPPDSGLALAPGLEGPQSITEPSLGAMGFGVTNMGHSVGAAAAGSPDLAQVIANWVNAGSAGVAGAGALTNHPTVVAGAAAFAAGYALGTAIDAQITYSAGQSLGEMIYDAVHGEDEQSAGGKQESSDAGSTPAGTQESESKQETKKEGEDKEDAGTSESGGTTGESAKTDDDDSESQKTSESENTTESEKNGESADAGTSEAESGRDPELPDRYRPSYGQIQSTFRETSVATTAHANPNPNADVPEAVDAQRSLTNTADQKLVGQEGRAANVGTVEVFGS